jgi:hypothetical protein
LVKSKTPAEWKAIVSWTKEALGDALRSSAVVDGTLPEEDELLEVLERLDEFHQNAAPNGECCSHLIRAA